MANILDTLGISNFVQLPSGFASAILASSLLVVILLTGLICYSLWYMKVAKYRVIIRENRGDQIGRAYKYAGKKITLNKTPRIKVMKFLSFSPIKDALPMPELTQLIHVGRKDMIIYEKRGNDYYPVEYASKQTFNCPHCKEELELDTPHLTPMDYKVRQWFVLNWKENQLRFKSQGAFEKYGPAVLFIVGMVILMIMWYGLLNKSEALSGGLSANAAATVELAKALQAFASSMPQ
jgi:hypothetical protein